MHSEIEFPNLLTLAEAAAILRVHRATVGRMVDDGEIPAIRVRGLPRIDAKALATYISSVAVAPAEPSPARSNPRGRPKKEGLGKRAKKPVTA